MSFKNRVIVMSSIGFVLGVVICQLISGAISTYMIADGRLHLCTDEFVKFVGGEGLAFSLQSLACGIYGSICFGGSSVYWLENWSIVKATVTHFLMTLISYYAIGFFLRWFRISDIRWCLIWFVIFIITYTAIGFGSSIAYRAEIKEINKELYELKNMHPTA